MFIQYRVRLVLMHIALFKIRLLRKSELNIRGPIDVTSPSSYAPGFFFWKHKFETCFIVFKQLY